MNLSVSLFSKFGDEYRLSLASVEDNRLSYSLKQLLFSNGIEIVEVFLDRIGMYDTNNINTLFAISEVIAKLFLENSNMILYFYCDDLGIIPKISKKHQNRLLPQEYRSKIFSSMFNRYMDNHTGIKVKNYTMNIGEGRFEAYLHFIARDEHSKYIDLIKQDVQEGYGK